MSLGKRFASNQWVALTILLLATYGMAAQLFANIRHYAVNILFSDQWDTYLPLFRGDNSAQIFASQIGQLRLGMGGVFYQTVALATNWNTKSEAYGIGWLMIISVVAAVFLKWRLFKSVSLLDVLIPLICLSIVQVEVPIIVPFPSHASVPILLLILYAICLTYENVFVRFGLLSVLNFLTLFTGWGIFVGFITPPLLLLLFLRAPDKRTRLWAGLSLLFAIGAVVLYFYDYKFYSGVGCFVFPHNPPTEYLWFVAKMFANSVGLPCVKGNYLWRAVGSLFVLAMIVAASFSFWKLLRKHSNNDSKYLVITTLIGFSFGFALFAGIGRVCTGICFADSGRYQPLLIPAWLGLYFAILAIEQNWFKIGATLLLMFFCFVVPQSDTALYKGNIKAFSESKIKWKNCYLANENAEMCDKEVGMSIFAPIPSSTAQDRIEYLKQNRLNFFADEARK